MGLPPQRICDFHYSFYYYFFFSFCFFFCITEIVEEAEKYPFRGNLSFLCSLEVWFRIL
ncbi:hypothetical protein L873DRAFT_822503 [Choiromyces venosus 120613-1]|uniref:Uncharacterized protein n=1 Tax=Choiromyces venosus 120613-1 TaxID=1336337 RepID=A0A3N4JTW9_9PEZI|nr:hypothetical protein L873DRAFT_822503 [Choiromyces venosus 120613-1]